MLIEAETLLKRLMAERERLAEEARAASYKTTTEVRWAEHDKIAWVIGMIREEEKKSV